MQARRQSLSEECNEACSLQTKSYCCQGSSQDGEISFLEKKWAIICGVLDVRVTHPQDETFDVKGGQNNWDIETCQVLGRLQTC